MMQPGSKPEGWRHGTWLHSREPDKLPKHYRLDALVAEIARRNLDV